MPRSKAATTGVEEVDGGGTEVCTRSSRSKALEDPQQKQQKQQQQQQRQKHKSDSPESSPAPAAAKRKRIQTPTQTLPPPPPQQKKRTPTPSGTAAKVVVVINNNRSRSDTEARCLSRLASAPVPPQLQAPVWKATADPPLHKTFSFWCGFEVALGLVQWQDGSLTLYANSTSPTAFL